MTRNLLVVPLLTCLLGALAVGATAQEARPVARVNGVPITEEQFRQTLVDWFGREVLEEMIQARVIASQAERAGVAVTDEQVDARLRDVQQSMDEAAQTGQGEPFHVWLATRRLTIPNFRARIRIELLLEGLVAAQVRVTPGEVSEYYEKNRRMFREPARVKISVISFKTLDEAKRMREAIVKGDMTWGDVARDHNVNPYTMKTGGELGYVAEDGGPLSDAAFALPADGDISEPLDYRNLYNLVRRDDRRSERTLPFEDIKETIEAALREQKMMRLKQEMRSALMKSAHIERLMEFPARPGGG